MRAALGELEPLGLGLACVGGIDAGEAVRRLQAAPVTGAVFPFDRDLRIVGVTTVPGGCIVTQP
ncbi:hypothetical protein GCM10010218_39720 [Streptomyces mashuensis]|uniref:Uncharacterized protein n=1 Tax=Streptomyces mashuensis TaxID=33904 RepID=A0A919B4T3_9ACTN|nr:hypothetical protein GCM10010218_39720 [Streptomyces mashuensis]